MYMRFVVGVTAVVAHSHNTCGVIPVEVLVVQAEGMLKCADPALTDAEFEKCTTAKMAVFEKLDPKCVGCLDHYFEDHLAGDAECWFEKKEKTEEDKQACLARVAQAPHDTCFSSDIVV